MKMGKHVSSKVCRKKQCTYKYKKRKGFNGKKTVVNIDVDDGDINVQSEQSGLLSLSTPTTPTVPPANVNTETPLKRTSANSSSNKVQEIITNTPKASDPISGYRLIDTTILSHVFGELSCPFCQHESLTLHDQLSKKSGTNETNFRPRLYISRFL